MSSKSSLLKVILLGDGGMGKSSLMNRYVTNKLDAHLFHTIGVEFLNKDLEVDGHTGTLQIWDTAGQPPPPFMIQSIPEFKSLRQLQDEVGLNNNLLLSEFVSAEDRKDI